MNKPIDLKATLAKMQARIDYLEGLNRRDWFGLDLLASLEELQHDASLARDTDRILEITRGYLGRLLDFKVLAFFMVNEEDADFELTQLEPEDERERIQNEIDRQIEDGTFTWVLQQNRPVIIKSEAYGKSLILHALATRARVRGIFAGVVSEERKDISQATLCTLSILLQSTAKAFESAVLYQMIFKQKRNLEKLVHRRTADLERQTRELKEEIAHRRLAEDSLLLAKQEAENAARAKDEYLAGISHEVRTPINAILEISGLIREKSRLLNRLDFVDDLKSIESAGQNLLNLINDVLDLSQIHVGKLQLKFEKFKVSELVENTINTVRPLIDQNQNKLEIIYEGSVDYMVSDSLRLRQILLNLLSNAGKYTRKGTITLRVYKGTRGENEWIYFMVRDSGIGIEPEKIPELFEEFKRNDSAATAPYGGTGLGLAISRRLSRMLGGDIRISSELGQGSVFTLCLPMLSSKETPDSPNGNGALNEGALDDSTPPELIRAGENHDSGSERPPVTEPHILLVEDDAIHRNGLSRILKKEGWGIHEAGNGKSALEILRRETPKVLLVNILISDMSGFELIDRIRSEIAGGKIPIIGLTPRKLTPEETDRLEGEVEHVFQKGCYRRDELVSEIRRLASPPDSRPPELPEHQPEATPFS